MPYIGRTPLVGAYQKCDALNASATADYTLQVSSTNVVPESVNHMIVSLNGVIQSPTTAYTVSGATLSFASALTSNDTIDFVILLGNVLDIGTPSDDTVATAKIQDDAVTSAKTDFFNANTSAADLGTGLHVKTGDSGVSAANTSSDELVIEGSGTSGLSILSGNSSSGVVDFGDDSDNNIGGFIYSHADNSLQTVVNASERMRIDSSGNLLFSTDTYNGDVENLAVGSIVLEDNGQVLIHSVGQPLELARTAGDTNTRDLIQFFREGSGVGSISCTDTTTAYNTSSDHRLKENVVTMSNATDRLKQLKPKRFNFIANADTTVDGFLAHEVSSVVPEAISGTHNETETKQKVVVNSNGNVFAENIEQADWETGKIADDDGNTQYPTDSTWEATKVVPVYQGIDQAKLVPLLVKTIQELEARITTLENA